MQLSLLAAKQKRVQEWSRLALDKVIEAPLRERLIEKLRAYESLLAKCWETDTVTERDQFDLEDLERQLEQISEEARLAANYVPSSPSR